MITWLLKANKHNFDLVKEMRRGRLESWPASGLGYWRRMEVGAKAFLYQTGGDDCIYGVGTIIRRRGRRYPNDPPGTKRFTVKFAGPALRDPIRRSEYQARAEFRNAGFLKKGTHQGNWKITDAQAAILFDLLAKRRPGRRQAPGHARGRRPPVGLGALRKKAYTSARKVTSDNPNTARRANYRRSRRVRAYVLARAAGRCEMCRKKAPFVGRSGDPYLEPHHIRQRSDKGPDQPDWVGALCPNCHGRIHHGQDGNLKNTKLAKVLKAKEAGLARRFGQSTRKA